MPFLTKWKNKILFTTLELWFKSILLIKALKKKIHIVYKSENFPGTVDFATPKVLHI